VEEWYAGSRLFKRNGPQTLSSLAYISVKYHFTKKQINMTTPSVSSILNEISAAGKAFEKHEAGSREALIEYGRALVSALEIPSEFIQRSFWAEVSFDPGLNPFLAYNALAGYVGQHPHGRRR
jgi:hypothetical protein